MQTIGEIDWKSIVEHLIIFGKKLGPGSAVVWEGLLVLKAASCNAFVAFKGGVEDLHNARVESLRKDRSDSPTDSTAETSGEPSQGNSNSVNVLEYTELRELDPNGPTEGLKRRAPFPQTSENVADDLRP